MAHDRNERTSKPAPEQRVEARGRAARSNDASRFDRRRREAFDDGWGDGDEPARQHETSLSIDNARSIISTNQSPDLHFSRTINPYRGCEHGCIYCYARPTHAYLGLSPGLDFETRLFFKPNAAALLEAELRKPGYVAERIQLGANTDPYQPVERRLMLTRAIISVLSDFNHPLAITTKGALVTRDIDLLAPMAEKNLAFVAISVTSLDRGLARSMEPRASAPQRRLEAIRQLAQAGIPVAVGVSPIIPGLNDHEIETIMEQAAAAGATSAYYNALRLPLEISDLFQQWLAAEQPDRAARIMSLVRQMRAGKDNDARFGSRMIGEGPIADLIAGRFRLARRRFGLDDTLGRLDTSLFRPPPKAGDQMTLF